MDARDNAGPGRPGSGVRRRVAERGGVENYFFVFNATHVLSCGFFIFMIVAILLVEVIQRAVYNILQFGIKPI